MPQRTDKRVMTAASAPTLEPFASILEYGTRIGTRQDEMLGQLDRLRDRPERWLIAGPLRIEQWHVGAIVVGPPGVFLVWPITTRVEPGLWATLRECREHVQACLGVQSQASVEVVVFSPSGERGHMQRWMDTEDDLLTADGRDLDRLLTEWQPVAGVYLGDEWIAELGRAAEPRESLYGPDTGAHQQFPRWSAARATLSDPDT